jgi:hypothetical protein
MSRNLHIFVLNASNKTEAEEKVTDILIKYGWEAPHIVGVLHKGETTDSALEKIGLDSMEKLNRRALEWSKPDEYAQKAIDKLNSGFPIDEMDELELLYISEYAKRMRGMKLDKRTCGVGFNILFEELNPFYFEKNGVTHIDYEYNEPAWVVVASVRD